MDVELMRRTVIWLDDEPSQLIAERVDLKKQGLALMPFMFLGDAYDWISTNRDSVVLAKALLIDATMPPRDDNRFYSSGPTPGGAILCELLTKLDFWSEIKGKVLMYTRLPPGPSFRAAATFAQKEGLPLVQKHGGSRIADDLIREGLMER